MPTRGHRRMADPAYAAAVRGSIRSRTASLALPQPLSPLSPQPLVTRSTRRRHTVLRSAKTFARARKPPNRIELPMHDRHPSVACLVVFLALGAGPVAGCAPADDKDLVHRAPGPDGG